MKKVLSYLITAVTIGAVLAGCGSGSNYKSTEASEMAPEEYHSDDMYEADYGTGAYEEAVEEEAAVEDGVDSIDVEKPALVIELKFNDSAESAIQQLKQKNYQKC